MSKNRFLQSPKCTKKYSFKYNGYGSGINVAQNLGMSEINILIYALEIHKLQTRIMSFPERGKCLKKLDAQLRNYVIIT